MMRLDCIGRVPRSPRVPAGLTNGIVEFLTDAAARWSKQMPIEFLHGRPLSREELEMIRQQIEEGFDNIAEVDPEIRGIVARNWPHLFSTLPPEEE
jgi:hypothetical protein